MNIEAEYDLASLARLRGSPDLPLQSARWMESYKGVEVAKEESNGSAYEYPR